MKDTGKEKHMKQQLKELQKENAVLRDKFRASPAATPEQVEALRRQIAALREENEQLKEQLQEGFRQLNLSVDAIMVSIAKKYGEDRGVGFHLSFPRPDLEALKNYEVKVNQDEGTGVYTVGVILRAEIEEEAAEYAAENENLKIEGEKEKVDA